MKAQPITQMFSSVYFPPENTWSFHIVDGEKYIDKLNLGHSKLITSVVVVTNEKWKFLSGPKIVLGSEIPNLKNEGKSSLLPE